MVAKSDIHDVFFLATEEGKLRKMIRLPNAKKSCLIEEIKIVDNGQPKPVINMKIATNKVSLLTHFGPNLTSMTIVYITQNFSLKLFVTQYRTYLRK